MLRRKIVYCSIIGGLTATAISACYWQITRYYQSIEKWKKIANELNKQNPDDLSLLNHDDLYPLKYVQVNGQMQSQYLLINRVRNGLIGSLIVRPLQYYDIVNNQQKYILSVVGWIPDNFEYNSKRMVQQFKGILREKQQTDYLHKRMKQTDIDKFNINTYIDVQNSALKLEIDESKLNQQYYLEVLKDEQELEKSQGGQSQQYYPQLYKVNNFALPYLTPDKHRAYAMFWGLTSMVGIGAIIKVLKMK